MMFIAITVALEMNIALLLKISFVLSGSRGNMNKKRYKLTCTHTRTHKNTSIVCVAEHSVTLSVGNVSSLQATLCQRVGDDDAVSSSTGEGPSLRSQWRLRHR